MAVAVTSSSVSSRPARSWGPVAFGLLVLYIPTYLDVYRVFWRSREGSYGAVMLVMVLWLLWRERRSFQMPRQFPAPLVGWSLLVMGLLFYVVGRSQLVYSLDVGSQIPVFCGVIVLMLGMGGLKKLWFPIVLLIFVVPIPGSVLDQFLLPLKEWVSTIVDNLLHFAGYPIARNGVVLTIGPYDLLIADACSGLNSMIALTGIALFYVYLAARTNYWINIAILASIFPIAFAANLLRVSSLVLVTYYFGEDVGASFHDKAAILEVIFAFAGLFAFDHLLVYLADRGASRHVLRLHA